MQIRLSVLARERSFAKAMRRVRPKLQPLLDAVEATELEEPRHEAILVGVTDDRGSEFFEEVPNNEGFFQILAGCVPAESDADLAYRVFDILQSAVRACPFSSHDRQSLENVFSTYEFVDSD